MNNITDSNVKASEVRTALDVTIPSKMDLVPGTVENEIAIFDSAGQVNGSGLTISYEEAAHRPRIDAGSVNELLRFIGNGENYNFTVGHSANVLFRQAFRMVGEGSANVSLHGAARLDLGGNINIQGDSAGLHVDGGATYAWFRDESKTAVTDRAILKRYNDTRDVMSGSAVHEMHGGFVSRTGGVFAQSNGDVYITSGRLNIHGGDFHMQDNAYFQRCNSSFDLMTCNARRFQSQNSKFVMRGVNRRLQNDDPSDYERVEGSPISVFLDDSDTRFEGSSKFFVGGDAEISVTDSARVSVNQGANVKLTNEFRFFGGGSGAIDVSDAAVLHMRHGAVVSAFFTVDDDGVSRYGLHINESAHDSRDRLATRAWVEKYVKNLLQAS